MAPEHFYHIYNRGNNRQTVFFTRDHYLYFLKKLREHLLPQLHLLSYCLMPNHFHLLVYTKATFVNADFSKNLRILLSSYTRAVNKQQERTGSLFQQNTKIKSLERTEHSRATTGSGGTTANADCPFICFQYIHHNPMKAKLVMRMEDWEMSSFRDYAGLRKGTLCDKELAQAFLDIPARPDLFVKQSYETQVIYEI